MKVHAVLFAAALGTTAFAPQAMAITPTWSSVAVACQPDQASGARLSTRSNRIANNSTNLSPIVLFCEVEASILSGQQWDLALTYQDSTGAGASAFVRATLMSMNRATGANATIATVNSNSSAATTITRGVQGFTHTFNFNTSYYYVVITLDRSATTESVQALGVSIDPFIP